MNIMYIENQKVKVSQSGKSCWTNDMVRRHLLGLGFHYRNKKSRERHLKRMKKRKQKLYKEHTKYRG